MNRIETIPEQQTDHLDRPLLIWDGDCGFCKYWVTRWESMTGKKVRYAPYQEVAEKFPAIPEAEFRRAAWLIEPDGKVYRGMGAAFRTFTYGERWGFLYRWYTQNRFFRKWNDVLYAWIARHRPFFYRLTRLLWGKDPQRSRPYWLLYLLLVVIVVLVLS